MVREDVMRLMPQNLKSPKRENLQNLTFRGWTGGLNAVEADISMDPRYCKTLNNFRRRPDGTQSLRFGSKWFDDIGMIVAGNIVDETYFANVIISVTSEGEIAATDNNGASTVIWNDTIAGLLVGSPDGWSSGLTSIDFVPFKDVLIIHNGVDKPISVNAALEVTYLVDAGTGSNVNVPIGKYGAVVSNYHCVAGLPAAPTEIYVSARGTDGTFPGDPDPNDSIVIDVGAYAPEGAPEIRGIAGFRSNLIVFFQAQSIVVQLGEYDDAGNHVPVFPDAIPAFGLLGHRCIVQVENDLFFAGLNGIGSVKRNLVSGLVDSAPLSDTIEPEYRRVIGQLTDTQQLKECFMIYDKLGHCVTLYTPGGVAFNYNFNERLRYKSWNKEQYPSYVCGCSTTLGRVFYGLGSRIFRCGNGVFTSENQTADRVYDRDADWTTGHGYSVGDIAFDTVTEEVYICIGDHTSGGTTFEDDRTAQALDPKWELYLGEEIPFELEMPWIDGRDPMQSKQNRYVSMATKGTAKFNLKVYVDNLYKDADGVVIYDPALEIEFIGNDAPGFGFDAGPYGGGRRSNHPHLYGFPVKFKSIKPIIDGSTRKPLEVATISFLYSRGRYHR